LTEDDEMIELQQGDILKADVEALVNAVNCVGVMGRGIALQFKNTFPENFEAYKIACDNGALRPGVMFVFELTNRDRPRYIINFPTKRHWKEKSRLEDIDLGLKALVLEIRAHGIRSLAIPALGCGLGGLAWSAIRPKIEAAFADLPEVRTVIYEPASESSKLGTISRS
jgi:O-acetyl-ADP-ribose deacetylase (regulator of RNase III)